MKWLKDLYVGEKAQARAKGLLRTAERGKKSRNDKCWLVALSSYPNAQLDLLSFKESRNKAYQGEKLTVLGIAANRAEAVSLVEKMANDCLRNSGTVQMKAYFAAQPVVSWREVSV
ncbi:MAG: hypothetical protein J5496_07420 [Lachnospiraceae bacterium]|nr:hypothetical protein [Lachnospiraceae bacterium]